VPVILATGFADLSPSAQPVLLRLNKPFDQPALARTTGNSVKVTGGRTMVPFRPQQG